MTTDPLFAENRAALLSQLRLSSADSDDAVAAIDAAIQAVGIGMYDKLGPGLVAQIKAIAYSDDLTTSADARLRLKAAVAEEKWVRAELLRKMPVLFRESRGTAYDRYNEEGLVADGDRVEDEISRLMDEANDLLDDLNGNTSPARTSALTFGPTTTPVYTPGGSVRHELTQEDVG
jgi:hypothetical protein